MKKVFLSHESIAKRDAVALKELLHRANPEIEVFLTSDWYSLESGAPWFDPLVQQLRTCDQLITIITRPEAFRNLWISFEIGAACGSGKRPKIFVYGGISWEGIPHPIAGLQLIDTGDTNRWVRDLKAIGIDRIEEYRTEFAKLFRQ
jgi:hypothetical protein